MTPPLSRHQRRAAETAAQQEYEKRGLPLGGSILPLVIHTRLLSRILANRRSSSRASDAADASIRSFELSARNQPPDLKRACQRGCAFCCYDPVAATAPEVFRVAREVGRQSGLAREAALQRLQSAHAVTAGASPEDRVRARRPCGMLDTGACSAYGVRPLVCRSANSASVQACEAAFQGAAIPVPAAKTPFLIRDNYLLCLLAALQSAGLDGRAFEFNHAMWVAVTTPDAEARWLGGEDIFATVQAINPAAPAQQALIRALRAEAAG